MITPSLVYDDAPAAIDWLTRTFGLVEAFRVTGESEDVIVYGELTLRGAAVMIETTPRNDLELVSPASLSRRTGGVCVTVPACDINDHHRCAQDNGATIVRPLADLDHGRQYTALDCEGHVWTFTTYAPAARATHLRDEPAPEGPGQPVEDPPPTERGRKPRSTSTVE